MKPDPQSEASLFEAALHLAGAAREAFLQQACGTDTRLRARIEALLAAHEQTDHLLSTEATAPRPTIQLELTEVEGPDEAVGQTLGRYKLLEKIGEGGCGVVYVAEQSQPVRRRVALKVIKLGMDTKQVVARFEAERQALAMMDHPNIAKVLDAGATETGRPYFVMELVRGIRITDYCDQASLTTKARLELFIKVCQAIQHAHQKGIIHRDIKPSNILVTLHDGVPVPKVIDFGIAKATEGRLTDATVYTQLHQFIGTPAYMSPEQAEMSGLDIDTRSDIYSLGVLLYELLAGATPFDANELMAKGLDAMRRAIREQEPVRPSTRLSALTREELTTTARRRSAEAPRLIHQLRGELDWIVMRTLEKDRTRRYETASGLAADIGRYLAGDPVVAVPPSAAYRLKKFIRRNRATVAAGATIAAILLVGLVAFAWEAKRAVRAEREARTRLAESEATVRFLDEMLGSADPLAKGKDVTVRKVLDEAAKSMGHKFDSQPLVAARLHSTIGRTYMGLGEYPSASTHMREAVAIRERVLGPTHEDTCRAVNDLDGFLIKSGDPEAEKTIKRNIADHEKHFGRRHEITMQSLDNLVMLYASTERSREALPLAQEVSDYRVATLGEEHSDTLSSFNTLATLYGDTGKFEPAQKLFERAMLIQDRLTSPQHPQSLQLRANLAWVQYTAAMETQRSDPDGSQRLLQKSRALGEQTLQERIRVLGEEHQDTLTSMNNLALVYKALKMPDQADVLERKGLDICLRVLGEEHPDTILALGNYGNSLRDQHRFEEALPYLERAIRNARKVLPPDNPGTAYNLGWYGSCLRELKRFSQAEPPLLEARGIIGRALGETSPTAQQMSLGLAMLYEAWDHAEPGKGYGPKAAEWKAKGPKDEPPK